MLFQCHTPSLSEPNQSKSPNLSFFVFAFRLHVFFPRSFRFNLHFLLHFNTANTARFKGTFALQSWQTRRRNDHGSLRCGADPTKRQSLVQLSSSDINYIHLVLWDYNALVEYDLSNEYYVCDELA